MSPTAKIAGVAVVAGLMLTVTVVSSRKAPPSHGSPVLTREIRPDPLTANMRRCRTITMPDSGCEAAWEAKRRHFFGKDER